MVASVEYFFMLYCAPITRFGDFALPYDPDRHHRRSIRLSDYDYAQAGAYFVTLCVQGWDCLLGEIVAGEVRLSAVGEIVAQTWGDLPIRFPNVELDAFVVMPNPSTLSS
jgi:putative transposase